MLCILYTNLLTPSHERDMGHAVFLVQARLQAWGQKLLVYWQYEPPPTGSHGATVVSPLPTRVRFTYGKGHRCDVMVHCLLLRLLLQPATASSQHTKFFMLFYFFYAVQVLFIRNFKVTMAVVVLIKEAYPDADVCLVGS